MTLSDTELLDAFESDTLDPAAFSHREHIRVAWLLLRRDGLPATLATYRTALHRLTTRVGKPDAYHETITFAFVLLVHEHLGDHREDFESFVARCPELFAKPSPLERIYLPETLASARARERFVLPDRWQLAGPTIA